MSSVKERIALLNKKTSEGNLLSPTNARGGSDRRRAATVGTAKPFVTIQKLSPESTDAKTLSPFQQLKSAFEQNASGKTVANEAGAGKEAVKSGRVGSVGALGTSTATKSSPKGDGPSSKAVNTVGKKLGAATLTESPATQSLNKQNAEPCGTPASSGSQQSATSGRVTSSATAGSGGLKHVRSASGSKISALQGKLKFGATPPIFGLPPGARSPFGTPSLPTKADSADKNAASTPSTGSSQVSDAAVEQGVLSHTKRKAMPRRRKPTKRALVLDSPCLVKAPAAENSPLPTIKGESVEDL